MNKEYINGNNYVHYYKFLDTKHAEHAIIEALQTYGVYLTDSLRISVEYGVFTASLVGGDYTFATTGKTIATAIAFCEERVHEYVRGVRRTISPVSNDAK